jgi:hypothetical protein
MPRDKDAKDKRPRETRSRSTSCDKSVIGSGTFPHLIGFINSHHRHPPARRTRPPTTRSSLSRRSARASARTPG